MTVAGRDNPADPVGFCRAASEEEYPPWQNPSGWTRSPRRTVLKGIVGAAGLVSIPAIIAACSSTQPRPRRRAAAARRRQCAAASAAPAPRSAPERRRLQLGSRRRRTAWQDIDAAFKTATGITVNAEHGRPQHVPGPDHQLPRRHAGHGLHVVLRVPHEVLRRSGLQHRDRRRVGQGQGQLHAPASPTRSSATTARSTASRSTTTRGRSSTARASSPTRATPSRRRGTSSSPCARRCRPTA